MNRSYLREFFLHPAFRRTMIYVLAYPEFEPGLAARLSRFRSLHEPDRAKLVPPHVTLVFGLTNPCPAEFAAFCETAAADAHVIKVSFAEAEVAHDPFEDSYKLFLMVSQGKDDLAALHDRLYRGPHREELDPSIPYRPHMTIATQKDRADLEALNVCAIGELPIPATIGALEIVERVGHKLRPLRRILLRQSGGQPD